MKRLGVALVVAVGVALGAPVSDAAASVGWTLKPSPNKIVKHGTLAAISCPATTTCEAVGFASNNSGAQVALAEGWNGSSWAIQPIPNPAGALVLRLTGVSCATTTQCVAVGQYSTGTASWAVVEAYNAKTWTIQPTPKPSGAASSNLSGVSCLSPTWCIAVGDFYNGSTTVTLAERWNGTKWGVLATPNPSGSSFSALVSVSCTNATECTAVGNYNNGLPFAERWDGTIWTLQSIANPPSGTNLVGVSCPAAKYCAAVGYYYSGTSTVSLAEGWDGTTWTVVPTPLPASAVGALLLSVSCTTSVHCTAVGYYFTGSGSLTLAEVWDGTSWTVQASPNPSGALASFLNAVSCLSATMCVAAGAFYNNTVDQSLAETWNGTSWGLTLPPNPSGAVATFLNGVSCTSPTSCVAVGSYGLFRGSSATVAMVWNGATWIIQSTPNPNGGFSGLNAVSCFAASACTAVGNHASGIASTNLAERWNGTSWKIQPVPSPSGAIQTNLMGVSCSAANACTAVGNYYNGSLSLAFAARWNGVKWTVQPTPNPSGTINSTLSAVSCTAPTACTGVGSYSKGSTTLTFVVRWNGTAWAIQTTPNPAGAMQSSLSGVSCATATQCTAVGSSQSGATGLTLAEHWNGAAWTIQTTPNPSGATYTTLFGLSCPSASQCTAVGNYSTSTANLTLAEQWNGTSWMIQTTPNPSGARSSLVSGTSCPTITACMAVGVAFNASPRTLTEQWTG